MGSMAQREARLAQSAVCGYPHFECLVCTLMDDVHSFSGQIFNGDQTALGFIIFYRSGLLIMFLFSNQPGSATRYWWCWLTGIIEIIRFDCLPFSCCKCAFLLMEMFGTQNWSDNDLALIQGPENFFACEYEKMKNELRDNKKEKGRHISTKTAAFVKLWVTPFVFANFRSKKVEKSMFEFRFRDFFWESRSWKAYRDRKSYMSPAGRSFPTPVPILGIINKLMARIPSFL